MAGKKGRGGAPPKIAETLKLEGGYREDRHGNRVDANFSPQGRPEKPDDLGPHGEEVWDRVVAGLPPIVLGTIDSNQLAECCRVYNEYRRLWIDDQKEKALKFFDRYNRLSTEFGMTPVARARMTVPKQDTSETNRGSILDRKRHA